MRYALTDEIRHIYGHILKYNVVCTFFSPIYSTKKPAVCGGWSAGGWAGLFLVKLNAKKISLLNVHEYQFFLRPRDGDIFEVHLLLVFPVLLVFPLQREFFGGNDENSVVFQSLALMAGAERNCTLCALFREDAL